MACDDEMVKRSMLVLAAALTLAACSRGAEDSSAPTSTQDAPASTSAPTRESSVPVDRGEAGVTTAGPTESSTVAADASAAPPSIVEVPLSGVPGLDSDDAFCAAWSQFGGSWQVLVVGSTFLGDADRVATWEIAASDVITTAYAGLIESFPIELVTEAELVADAYFGALQRRAQVAGTSLSGAGADPEAVRRLGQAWLDALARRDPFDADLSFEVPDDLRPLVEAAVADFRSQRVELHLDPSMVIGAETPLTDAYLETACPDQGTLSGQEVDGG
jgi:hypothetical protein